MDNFEVIFVIFFQKNFEWLSLFLVTKLHLYLSGYIEIIFTHDLVKLWLPVLLFIYTLTHLNPFPYPYANTFLSVICLSDLYVLHNILLKHNSFQQFDWFLAEWISEGNDLV